MNNFLSQEIEWCLCLNEQNRIKSCRAKNHKFGGDTTVQLMRMCFDLQLFILILLYIHGKTTYMLPWSFFSEWIPTAESNPCENPQLPLLDHDLEYDSEAEYQIRLATDSLIEDMTTLTGTIRSRMSSQRSQTLLNGDLSKLSAVYNDDDEVLLVSHLTSPNYSIDSLNSL